ncbi:MAG: DUF4395 domain-containing protein [Gammaproteobacteria bacterium]|jgi:hypothetical protein
MDKIIQFGEIVEGYSIPVLNEREIRAAAGILFLMMLISVMVVILKENFLLIKYAITVFLIDILIRVFVNPKFSPTLIIGRLFVRNQVPEYVGAQQKKFAWMIGAVLASIFFILMVVLNAASLITGIICLTCLVFLFFETAFGICLGCKFYSIFHKDKARYCPGEVCVADSKQAIQKISLAQMLVLFGFITFIFLAALSFNEYFNEKPYDMFGISSSSQT